MDSTKLKRRSWIKNIAIIFLAVMLFLTFFSNTIMNFSLPEVSAQYPSSGTITTRVRKTGNVSAAEDYEVILDETRNLLGVEVKKGDTVAIGDLLFTLEEGDSKEVDNAIKAYENAKVEYDKKLLTLDMDYTTLTNAVADASSELVKLRNKKYSSGDNVIKQLNKNISDLEKDKSDLEWEIGILNDQKPTDKYEYSILGKTNETILADANSLYEQAKSAFEASKIDLDKAESDMKTAESDQKNADKTLELVKKELENYKQSIGDTSKVTDATILEAKRNIEALELKRLRANEELDIANSNWQKAISEAYNAMTIAFDAYQKAKDELGNGGMQQRVSTFAEQSLTPSDGSNDSNSSGNIGNSGNSSNLASLEAAYIKASEAFNSIQSTKPTEILTKERAAEDILIEIRNAREDLKRDEAKLYENENNDAQLKKHENAVDHAQSYSDLAKENFTEAEKNFKNTATTNRDDAEKLMNGYLRLKLETEVKILNEKVRDINNKIKDIENEIKDIGTPVTDSEMETAEKAVKTAQEALDEQKKKDAKTHESELLQLEVDEKNLERLLADVERLKKNNIGTEVRAKIAGMISEINFVAGNEVKAGDRLAKIQVVQKGYYVEFDVTNEEAARIRPGEAASLQYYWGSTIETIVESIKNSTTNPGKAKTVRISIAGEVDVGRQLTFNLGERGQNYDTVVPKSAIREDSNGKFILTVVSKSTPLGNRYTAVRVDVTVLEEDDTNCAINLGLYGSEFIITTSTKPIKDGDQVRLVDR